MQILETIGAVLGVIAAIGAIFAIVAYGRAQWKKGTAEALRENNQALSDLLETTKKKLEDMDCDLRSALGKISELEGKVNVLTQQKGALQDLVKEALEDFFTANPNMAMECNSIYNK